MTANVSWRKRNPIALLTGGADKPYAFGLATALSARQVPLDVVAGDDLESPALLSAPGINFLNLRGNQRTDVSPQRKAIRVFAYYVRLIAYAFQSRASVFHILWNNKFEFFDRTALMCYYRLLGKRIVLTVHNVNAGVRDGNDSWLNRLTLRIQYRLASHMFVHTDKMKSELIGQFGVAEDVVTVIPFGVNNSVPNTDLSCADARRQLGIASDEKVILFFGNIAEYKGLDLLVDAWDLVGPKLGNACLVVAGTPKPATGTYWPVLERRLRDLADTSRLVLRIEFVRDEETEIYLKAADVLVLPYRHIFQSGVLVLSYTFGLPVIAANVGSLSEDVVIGRTGFMFEAGNAADLAHTIDTYFRSPLFHDLPAYRQTIRDYAKQRHSWDIVADITEATYSRLLPRTASNRSQATT